MRITFELKDERLRNKLYLVIRLATFRVISLIDARFYFILLYFTVNVYNVIKFSLKNEKVNNVNRSHRDCQSSRCINRDIIQDRH